MDEAGLSSIVTILALIAVHAWMEFTYAVLTNVRRTPLRERSEMGDTQAKRILNLAENHGRLALTRDVMLMSVRFAIAVVLFTQLVLPMIIALENLDTQADQVLSALIVIVGGGLLTYVLGDLIPSALGVSYADQAARLVALPAQLIVTLLRPLVAFMTRTDALIAQITRGENFSKAVTEEEIKSLVDFAQGGGTIEDDEKEMIYSVLDFGETLAREIMIPRPDIVSLEIDSSMDEALTAFIASGHSRIPVYEESVDDIKGFLYAKDLLPILHSGAFGQASIRGLLRPAYFVPETKRADMLFRDMQEKKVHVAIVVDEYGGTAGLVSIEDLIEEIVGDIRDEYDINEENEYLQIGEREYIVDGSMNLDDLNELLDSHLPTDENDSVGGYIYSTLGRVPEVGEIVDVEGEYVRMRVEAVENRRIRKVHVVRLETPSEEEEREAEAEENARENKRGKNGTSEVEAVSQPRPAQR